MTPYTLCKPSGALGLTSMGQHGLGTLRELGVHRLLSVYMQAGRPIERRLCCSAGTC